METIIFLFGLVLFAPVNAVLPANYQSLTAAEKQSILWQQVTAKPYNSSYLPWQYISNNNMTFLDDYRELVPDFIKNVFLTDNDEMILGYPKFIFPLGVAFLTEYVAMPNSSYTGLYMSGGIGITRWASPSGLPPPLLPVMSVKVLVSGSKSYNFIMTQTLDPLTGPAVNYIGQMTSAYRVFPPTDSWVFKSHQGFIKTVAQLPGGPLDRPLNAMSTGLVAAATLYNNGTNVTGPVIAPYQIRAVPTGNVNVILNTLRGDDFRVALMNTDIKDKALYYIQAQSSPGCDDWTTIATLYGRSQVVSSFYEDQVLLFQHQTRRWDPSVSVPGGCPYGQQGVTDAYDMPETTVVDITPPATTLSTFAWDVFTQPAENFAVPTTVAVGTNVGGNGTTVGPVMVQASNTTVGPVLVQAPNNATSGPAVAHAPPYSYGKKR